MKRNIFASLLAVAVLSLSTVNSFTAKAGVLGLKPSANQSATQSSGNNTNATNTEVQNVQYDTGKYQYPAQQLAAENRQFDKYDWKLFQRFDTQELMYNEWAAAMNFHISEYSENNYRNNEDGTTTRFFDFRDSNLKYSEIEVVGSSGKKFFGTDNKLRFNRNDDVNTYIPISLNVRVYTSPEKCFPYGTLFGQMFLMVL